MKMHRACNWVIMVNLDDSTANTQQSMARLYRVGSEKRVRWIIVIQAAPLARVQERACHTKLVDSLSVTSQLQLEISGDLRAIVCYDVARGEFGAMESKYAVFYSWLASLTFETLKQWKEEHGEVEKFAHILNLIGRMNDLAPVLRAMCLLIQSDHDSNWSTDAWLGEANWAVVDKLRSRMRDDQERHGLDIKGLEDHYWKNLEAKRGVEAARSLTLKSISFTLPPPSFPRSMSPSRPSRASNRWMTSRSSGTAVLENG